MAIDDALKYNTLLEFQDMLETKVTERTEELTRVRDELTRAIEELRRAQAARDRLFANISHEFRTPLTLIKGPIDQLLSGATAGTEQVQYQLIRKNCERLLELVNQLLDLSRIESGQMKLRAQEMDLADLLQGVTSVFESTCQIQNIELTYLGPVEPLAGWFDRDCVTKILTNLLSNAIKFTQKGGRIVVSVSKHAVSKTVEITVADSGIGIPADKLERIFDRFYQVDASQIREQEGTGIGLALTKELVELHKGNITVSSEVGKGTTFLLHLPLGSDHLGPDEFIRPLEASELSVIDTQDACEDENERVVIGRALPLILLIEDNDDLRKHMRSYLDNGYRVLEATNGKDGLQKAVETIPDLVISDVMMPKMDGFALCTNLKTDERTSHIPIILLTAKAGAGDKVEGLETGADAYLTKPFDARELQVRARNLIDQRRKLREKFGKEIKLKPADIAITSADERFLKKALEIVEANISDSTFTAQRFAREMFLSQMQLHRKIKALTNRSPWEFFRTIRPERASQLVKNRAGNVAEIAYQVGYSDPSHFADAFKRQFGTSPSELMQKSTNAP